MRMRTLAAAVGLVLAPSAPLRGQMAWDAPMLVAPESVDGAGLYLMEGWPGEGVGALLTWRQYRSFGNLGFRVGLGEGVRDDLAVFGGLDYAAPWIRATQDFPLDIAWFLGGGLGVGPDVLLSFPLGVSIGRVIHLEDVGFIPYVAPRLDLDAWLGDDVAGRDDDLDLRATVDLGTDILLNEQFTLRFGASVGDRDALAIGLVFGAPSPRE